MPGSTELLIGFVPYSRFNAYDRDCLRPIDPTVKPLDVAAH